MNRNFLVQGQLRDSLIYFFFFCLSYESLSGIEITDSFLIVTLICTSLAYLNL